MNEVVVGAPAFRRGWILPRWVDHAAKACANAGLEPTFVVVAGRDDSEAWDGVADAERLDRVEIDEPRVEDRRDWANPGRFERMVELRNTLLGRVRELAPPLFLSVDTDILLHPDAVANMVDSLRRGWHAVGGGCYMNTGTANSSYATLLHGSLYRPPAPGGAFIVDVIMALKLMTPAAYRVDYEYHRQGEDIGWSIAARRAGLALGWDNRVTSKHVLRRTMLDRVDPRCGF